MNRENALYLDNQIMNLIKLTNDSRPTQDTLDRIADAYAGGRLSKQLVTDYVLFLQNSWAFFWDKTKDKTISETVITFSDFQTCLTEASYNLISLMAQAQPLQAKLAVMATMTGSMVEAIVHPYTGELVAHYVNPIQDVPTFFLIPGVNQFWFGLKSDVLKAYEDQYLERLALSKEEIPYLYDYEVRETFEIHTACWLVVYTRDYDFEDIPPFRVVKSQYDFENGWQFTEINEAIGYSIDNPKLAKLTD